MANKYMSRKRIDKLRRKLRRLNANYNMLIISFLPISANREALQQITVNLYSKLKVK